MTTVASLLPASLVYDPSLHWWSGTGDFDVFNAFRIEVPETRSTPAAIELLVAVNLRAARAGQIAPTSAQASAYRYLLENQQHVADVTLAAIAKGAPAQRAMFAQVYTTEILDQLIPVALAPEQLKRRVRLGSIQIVSKEKDGVAYIEYGFSCAWDREHRLMVVLHKDRLVYFGGTGDGWGDRAGGADAG